MVGFSALAARAAAPVDVRGLDAEVTPPLPISAWRLWQTLYRQRETQAQRPAPANP
jgi:hypothetical protein